MKKYAELGTVNRCEPCQEYPGKWLIFVNGSPPLSEETFTDFESAWLAAKKEWETSTLEVPPRVTVCWQASDDDPRIGEVWFTNYFQHGSFDKFGRYIL